MEQIGIFLVRMRWTNTDITWSYPHFNYRSEGQDQTVVSVLLLINAEGAESLLRHLPHYIKGLRQRDAVRRGWKIFELAEAIPSG